MRNQMSLFERVQNTSKQIPTDILGGSPLVKTYLMAYLASRKAYKTYVEIGVYKGKSLFPVAEAFKENKGKCYGIDPWTGKNLKEKDVSQELKELIDHQADCMDFDALYYSVLENRQRFAMEDTVTLLRQTSEEAVSYFMDHADEILETVLGVKQDQEDSRAFIDMLHIDGNHDYQYVSKDAELYIPLVRQGGVIVFDDINWESVRKVYEKEKKKHIVLFECGEFGILLRDTEKYYAMQIEEYPALCCAEERLLQIMLPEIMKNVRWTEKISDIALPIRVFAAVMTYNSGKYIEENIRSIISQKGSLDIEIGVFDDCSQDNTVQIVNSIKDIPPNVHLTVYTNYCNEGYEKNYLRVFQAFEKSGCDFLTCVDGDDYLCSPYRILRHVEEMKRHPECAVTFNRMLMYFQDTEKYTTWDEQDKLDKECYTAFDLAKSYLIGNGSCSMVRRNAALALPDTLFTEAKIGDWLTHCMYAQRGDICYIDEAMNVYRKHDGGIWSGENIEVRSKVLYESLRVFNKITDYIFYQQTYERIAELLPACQPEKQDLVIIDDVFPHPVSGFRLAEYFAYLEHFDKVKVICNGSATSVLGKKTHPEIMAAFKQKHPEFADNLIEARQPYLDAQFMLLNIKAKLAYFCFLGNVYASIGLVEKNKIPFVFELYPGGSFSLYSVQTDRMLRRVMNSPCFRKVIVTQDVTRDYLLEHGFCQKEQIVEIFGVVMPQEVLGIQPEVATKQERKSLNVCFAAMRYTLDGRDKGYDTFVKVIEILAQNHKDIRFHVAGGFDENVISLEKYKKYVTFHGVLENSELRRMMQEMDIIVSPNRNNCILPGAFDGFPTATCTEAGLCGTLIMCTDPLELNNGRFKNKEEIEIVPQSAEVIADRILYYNQHRDKLQHVIQKQHDRIQALYATEVQVDERIQVLEEEIDRYSENLNEIKEKSNQIIHKGKLFWSGVPDRFEMEDVIEFDYEITYDGRMTAKIPLGDLNVTEAYVWVYLINEGRTIYRYDSISYAGKMLSILESSPKKVRNRYIYEDTAPFVYFGLVKGICKKAKYMDIEARVKLVTNPECNERVNQKSVLTGAVLHAESLDKINQDDVIPFEYCIEEDGRFAFEVSLESCPHNHCLIWVYFVANHRCRCRFEAVNIKGKKVKIAHTNGVKDGNKEYLFDTIEPFIYLGHIRLGQRNGILRVKGQMNLLD